MRLETKFIKTPTPDAVSIAITVCKEVSIKSSLEANKKYSDERCLNLKRKKVVRNAFWKRYHADMALCRLLIKK